VYADKGTAGDMQRVFFAAVCDVFGHALFEVGKQACNRQRCEVCHHAAATAAGVLEAACRAACGAGATNVVHAELNNRQGAAAAAAARWRSGGCCCKAVSYWHALGLWLKEAVSCRGCSVQQCRLPGWWRADSGQCHGHGARAAAA
jgi:hypothetical protein